MRRTPRYLAFGWLLVACLTSTRVPAQVTGNPPKEYKNNEGGLRLLVKGMLNAAKEGRNEELKGIVNSLELPGPEAWFRTAFGDSLGGALTRQYRQGQTENSNTLVQLFGQLSAEKITDVDVVRFESACVAEANEDQYPVLAARQQKEPLYEVRVIQGNMYNSLWFFAYAEGGFRFLGRPKIEATFFGASTGTTPSEKGDTESSAKRIRLGGNVQHARLVKHVPPEYPLRALQAGLQGTVRMVAILGKDGRVRELHVLEGHCWLAEAALRAVKKWQYSPTLLDGQPVEVSVTIDVGFTRRLR